MNQLPLTATPQRQTVTADAPSVMYVLRRYAWMILGGAVLGTAAATGLYLYLLKTSPYYASEVTFQVLPPPNLLSSDTQQVVDVGSMNDEIATFIRRQAVYLKSDRLLNEILQRDEFRRDYRDPNGTKPSMWLADHPSNPKKYLKEDMEIDQTPTANLFSIRMMSKDPTEAARLVNAIADVYVSELQNDTKQADAQRLHDLQQAMLNQQSQVTQIEKDLNSFRDENHIPALTQRHEVEVQILAELNAQVIKLEGDLAAAQSTLDGMKAMAQSPTMPLTADAQAYVENDPRLRTLIATKDALEQQKVATAAQSGAAAQAVRELDQRMAKCDEQIRETRDQLSNEARQRMVELADAEYKKVAAQLDSMTKDRDDQNKLVEGLDRKLVDYQQRSAELTRQQSMLDKVSAQYQTAQLKSPFDDSRVRKFGGDAVPADASDVAWPIHWKFIVPGALLGLLLSFGGGYLAELLNTRVRTPRDITKTMQLPMLGFVPDESDDDALVGDIATAIRTSPTSMVAESFRQIRGRVLAQPEGQPLQTLLVASVAPDGGATTVASNLALGLAMHNLRVLLVDANFHRPGLRQIYKNLPAVGLSDVIADPSKLPAALMEVEEQAKLHVMSSGTRSPVGGSEILETKAFRELVDQLKSRYDMVIFDGAPLSLVSDALTIGGRVDGVLAVVRAGEVSRGMVARVRDQLRGVRANLLGVVLNAAQTHGAGYFKKNYKTFYKYAGQGGRAEANA
ncbi:MAG TPA: polysaccharide biosynthesis tyrosine autokinase [Phycisphaerae bacterium]|nr:polysaccharide biosynthesis tyrosine autokinase [Phycisphaerae bacterium]